MPCGSTIGHDGCNFAFNVIERDNAHKASSDAWQDSKNKSYRKKMAKQHKGS